MAPGFCSLDLPRDFTQIFVFFFQRIKLFLRTKSLLQRIIQFGLGRLDVTKSFYYFCSLIFEPFSMRSRILSLVIIQKLTILTLSSPVVLMGAKKNVLRPIVRWRDFFFFVSLINSSFECLSECDMSPPLNSTD